MLFVFFQAEDGIRYLVRSRGLGDVYKRQGLFDVVLVELRDRRRIAAGGLIDRAKIGNLARRDQHAAGMHANISGQIFESTGEIEQFANRLAVTLVVHQLLKRWFLLQRLGQRYRLVLDARDHFGNTIAQRIGQGEECLLYTSDAADERSSVDLGGCGIIKKKKKRKE